MILKFWQKYKKNAYICILFRDSEVGNWVLRWVFYDPTLTGLRLCQVVTRSTCQAAKLLTGLGR